MSIADGPMLPQPFMAPPDNHLPITPWWPLMSTEPFVMGLHIYPHGKPVLVHEIEIGSVMWTHREQDRQHCEAAAKAMLRDQDKPNKMTLPEPRHETNPLFGLPRRAGEPKHSPWWKRWLCVN